MLSCKNYLPKTKFLTAFKHEQKFMLGYKKMLKIIKPSAIICYGKPFKDMVGNIKVFPYNRHENSEAKYGI